MCPISSEYPETIVHLSLLCDQVKRTWFVMNKVSGPVVVEANCEPLSRVVTKGKEE